MEDVLSKSQTTCEAWERRLSMQCCVEKCIKNKAPPLIRAMTICKCDPSLRFIDLTRASW